MSEPLVPRDETRAALEARRELGVEYEQQIADALAERVEQRLAERRPQTPEKAPSPPGLVVPLASIGMGIPITGAANGMDNGELVAIVAWIAIAIVNVAYALRR